MASIQKIALFRRIVLSMALVLLTWNVTISTLFADETADRWILLSDTHIPGEYDRELNNCKPNANLAQARGEILALDDKPAGVIMTGDAVFLTGEVEDYKTLVKQLEPFVEAEIPVYPLLGNHDNYANLVAHAGKFAFETPVEGKQVTIIETPHANWFLLDSLEKTNSTPGLLGDEQLKWLAAELDKRPDKPAIIAAHHNVEEARNDLKDHEKFWAVVKSRKQVKAYIFGHTHVYQNSVYDGVHMINLPAMAWRFDEKQPVGWTEATITPDGLELKLHTLDKEHPKNNDVRKFQWR